MKAGPGLTTLYTHLGAGYIPGLDGVRTVAVLLVILYHFGFSAVPGGDGVMMFFVLSGFLITWLLLGEQAATGRVSLRAFYWRRTLRIFPAFYAFWFLVVALGALRFGEAPSEHAWSAFFYLSNYYSALNDHPEGAFSHTWSLALEEQFYLLWPFAFLCCRGDLRRLTYLIGAVIGGVLLHRLALTYIFDAPGSYIYSAFDTRVDQLMVGCLVAVLLKRRALEGFWTRACAYSMAPVLTLGLLVGSLVMGDGLVPRYRDGWGYTVHAALYGVLIVQLIALSGSPLWSWLNSAPLRFLGRISYPLYLYQQITLYPVRSALAGYPVPFQLAVAIALTVTVASLSYYMIERPFLRLKRRPSASQLPQAAVAAV